MTAAIRPTILHIQVSLRFLVRRPVINTETVAEFIRCTFLKNRLTRRKTCN